MTEHPRDRWLRHAPGDARPAVRLLCFPHAGGSASSFNAWRKALPPWIELVKAQLPGREERRATPAHDRMEALLPLLFAEVEPLLDDGLPLALYGHSMGALVAYEVAMEMRRRGHAPPLALLVSSRRAPHLPSPRHPLLHRLSEDELIRELGLLGGMDPLLLSKPRWLRYYLPTIRADLCLSDEYVHLGEPPLDCPLHAFIGEADNLVVREEWLHWDAYTTASFARYVLPGGHFLAPAGVTTMLHTMVDVIGARLGARGAHDTRPVSNATIHANTTWPVP